MLAHVVVVAALASSTAALSQSAAVSACASFTDPDVRARCLAIATRIDSATTSYESVPSAARRAVEAAPAPNDGPGDCPRCPQCPACEMNGVCPQCPVCETCLQCPRCEQNECLAPCDACQQCENVASADKDNIGSLIWVDHDCDGRREFIDGGLAGVRVELLDENGEVISATTSDANGEYKFRDVGNNAQFTVRARVPTRYQLTVTGRDSPAALVNNGNHADASVFTRDSNCDCSCDVNFGFCPPATSAPTPGPTPNPTPGPTPEPTPSPTPGPTPNPTPGPTPLPTPAPTTTSSIGDRVWVDSNGNGCQDDGEPGVANAEIKLWNDDCSVELSSTTTDADGFYTFSGLNPNTQFCLSMSLCQGGPTNNLYPTRVDERLSCPQGDTHDSDSRVWETDTAGSGCFPLRIQNVQSPGNLEHDPTYDFGLYDCAAADPINGDSPVTLSGDTQADVAAAPDGVFAQLGEMDVRSGPEDNKFCANDGEPLPDIGLAPASVFPPGTFSGFDMRAVELGYSSGNDELLILIDCYGICGDADGNGDPSVTKGTAMQLGLNDKQNLADSETFCVLFDLDLDGGFDYVVGIPSSGPTPSGCMNNDISCLDLYTYEGAGDIDTIADFGGEFGSAVSGHDVTPVCNPSASCPDLQIRVTNWSDLSGLTFHPYAWVTGVAAFGGSIDDAGFGEDFIHGCNIDFICPPDSNFKKCGETCN